MKLSVPTPDGGVVFNKVSVVVAVKVDLVPVNVGSGALDVLGVLIDRHGELVSKDAIMSAAWPETVVADRLGHPPETTLTLGRSLAGSSARIKARGIWMPDEAMEATGRLAKAEALRPAIAVIVLLGREIPVVTAADGTHRANEKGKGIAPHGARSCIARAFGDRLEEVRSDRIHRPCLWPIGQTRVVWPPNF
jgi:hypothetical protein